jgi:hypothetical protein
MGDVEKRLNKSALIIGAAWGTEADANAAGTGLLPLNQGVAQGKAQMLEDESYGAFENRLTVGNYQPVDFPFDHEYRWDGNENKLLAALFGTAPAPTPHFVVTTSNNKIDFDEGGAELTGSVAVGTLAGRTAYTTAIATAMNGAVGKALTYTCTFSTTTGKLTIGAGASFTIRWNTGTHKTTDISTMAGYSDAADDTGLSSYVGDTVALPNGLNYLHTLTLADSVVGKFFTYATEKGAKIFVVPSLKVLKGSFSFSGGFIKVSFGVRGSQVINDSAIVTSLGSVTIPANAHLRAIQSQAVFRMNAQTGNALDSDDTIRPKAFTFDPERKMDGEFVAGSRVVIEPLENDKPSFKLTLEFPRMDTVNDDYFSEWIAGTEKKMDITITGPIIDGAYAYYLKFEFPRLIVEDVEYADSKIIPAKIVLRAVVADAAPTGMTGKTLPVYGELMNTRATSLLI